MGVAGARVGRSDGLESWQGGRLLRRAGGVELERVELSFGASPSRASRAPPVTQTSTSQPESIWPSAMSGGYRGDIAPDSPANDAVVLLFVPLDSRSSAPAELSRERLDRAAFDINRRHRMHTRGRPWVTPCFLGSSQEVVNCLLLDIQDPGCSRTYLLTHRPY